MGAKNEVGAGRRRLRFNRNLRNGCGICSYSGSARIAARPEGYAGSTPAPVNSIQKGGHRKNAQSFIKEETMKITNELGMPEAFVNFVSNVRHNEPGTLSATTLLQGDKQIVLYDRHFDELAEDAADLVWATFGTAFHTVMEKQDDDAFKEEKFEVPVGSWKVTGKCDRYDMEHEIIEDWKTTSVWKIIYGDFKEWKAQGLTYAWLMKQAGLNVKRCRFLALLKDHSKTEAKRKSDYPQKPVFIYEFDVTEADLEETEKRIKAKIESVTQAYKLADDEIAPCSEEERWATATKYAVMKDGRKTALKVCDTMSDAQTYMRDVGGDRIDVRPGESKRCADYCPCAQFCSFYHECVEQKTEEVQSA